MPTETGDDAGPPPEGLSDALAHTTFVTMSVLTKVAADHDLSLTQLRVLAILRDRRVRMSTLATYLGLDKSTMTGLVSRAEQRGLLARLPNDADGRAVDVALTASGHELAVRLQARTAEGLASLTAGLSTIDRQRLHALLVRALEGGPG